MQSPENIGIAPGETPGVSLTSGVPVDLLVDAEVVELDVVKDSEQDGVARQKQRLGQFG
jgi:hypothetical protein